MSVFQSSLLHPESMISWKEFQESMPWNVALLVGGGFALAEGTKVPSFFDLYLASISTFSCFSSPFSDP